MATIDLGQFGFRAPQAPPLGGGIAIPQAFVSGPGLDRVAEGLEKAADVLHKRQAIADSTREIIAAKQAIDEWEGAQKQRRVNEDGTPAYETATQEFDKFGRSLLDKATRATGNRDAQDVISRDLSNYLRAARDRVGEQAAKQRMQFGTATTMQQIDDTAADPKIDTAEKTKRIYQILGAAVEQGFVAVDKAQELAQKKRGEIEYLRIFDEVGAAGTISQAYELRGKLAKANPLLSPEQNRQIRQMVDERIRNLDKETDDAVRRKQDDIAKMLIVEAAEGRLTKDRVRLYQNDLQPAQFEKFMGLPDVAAKQRAEAADDPEIFRRIQKDMLGSYRDARALARLRDRVSDYMTGFDPATRTFGTPALSRQTGRQLINDIEEYIGRVRSDADRQKNEIEQKQDREFRDVERLLKGAVEAYKGTRIGRAAQAEAEAIGQKAQEDLLKNRDKAGEWWENWKKQNASILDARPQLPSWVIQSNGKADIEGTRKRLLDDKKAGRISEPEYRNRFDRLQQLERANAPK